MTEQIRPAVEHVSAEKLGLQGRWLADSFFRPISGVADFAALTLQRDP
ncbi:hypothetical protein [Bradyrhizobium sp. SZCCHNS1054]|nr:hypothetical protein [Bradyrhizobium sp. SZCCHNS1054]